MSIVLSKSDLAETLGVHVAQVENWIAAGLPYSAAAGGRRQEFEPDVVAEWLVANDQAAEPDSIEKTPTGSRYDGPVARTRVECAEFFDVHVRTVATWLNDPSFPGEAGDAGDRNGFFPLDKIAAWLELKDKTRENRNQHSGRPGDPTKQAFEEIKLKRLHFKFQQETGHLLDAAEVRTEMLRVHALAKQKLNPLVDMLVGILPAELDSVIKADYRKRAATVLRQTYDLFANAIAEFEVEAAADVVE